MSQESKIDPAIIKKTQDTLGRLIQAPSLTEKLLNRPPVQFIQDIVKSVIKNTGFMKGLYPQDELEASFIKSSKENKLLFLNKLIISVGLAVGEQLSAKANKIAAGVEAEKTNELFQALAKAINMKPDNDEVVKRTFKKLKSMDSADDKNDKEDRKEKSRDKARDEEKEIRDRAKNKTEESGKSRDRDREKERNRGDREKDKDRERKDRDRGDRDKDRERKDRGDREKERDKDRERKDRGDREKERDKDRERKERDRGDKEKERERDRDREKDKSRRDKDRKERDQEKLSDRSGDHREERERELRKERKESRKSEERTRNRHGSNDENQKENHKSERAEEEISSRRNEDDSEESSNRRRPSSARGPRIQIDRDENNSHRSHTETLEEPTTARPGAPRPKINNESSETPVKVASAAKKSTLIVHDDSDSDGDFVVKENNFQEDDQKNWKGLDDFKKPGDEEEDEKHGALVTKILESKGKLEHGNELHKNLDQQKPTIQMDLQRKKERERTQKEIDKLKDSIQTLTKASIPLGRTLDFLQEDIDMMQKEIIKWSDEYDSNCRVLKRQQAEMHNFIEPYKEALRQIENQIVEQMDRIGTVKRNILLNEEKISRLIFNIGKS